MSEIDFWRRAPASKWRGKRTKVTKPMLSEVRTRSPWSSSGGYAEREEKGGGKGTERQINERVLIGVRV